MPAAETRRNAIVTGSASGLGRAFALRLAREGWRIALVDFNAEGNAETLALVNQAGGEGRCENFDVRSIEAWENLRDRLRKDWLQLDLIVNNAGIGGSGEVGAFTLENWRDLVDTNLMSVVYSCHTMIEWLKENPGRARIINVSSIASQLSLPCMAAYCAAKSGVVKLSEALCVEMAKFDVGVTVLVAGFFQSGLMKLARMTTEFEYNFSALSMERSRISADDMARAALAGSARRKFFVVVVSRKIWWFYQMSRFLPRTFMGYVTRQWLNGPPEWV
jgi:NAD(P)-dependent dehydrogenase (short-subunit alcohol dehydrogenase family)